MLEHAGVISKTGQVELAAIVKRRSHLDRAVDDRDFFTSYSTGVRRVLGDAAPIVEADPDDRLKVAAELSKSPDLDRQMGWRTYCRTDPKGAFETLSPAGLTPPNLELWNDLLAAISMNRDEKEAELRNRIAVDAMARLEGLDPDALRPIATSAVDLLMFGPRRDIANLEDWCDRLWAAMRLQDQDIDFEKSLYESAINRASGRLAQVLLSELDHSRKTDGADDARQRERLDVVADDDSKAGVIARAVLVHDLAFLLLADPPLVHSKLVPRIIAPTDEGRALRATLVTHSAITPEVSKLLPGAIIEAVIEVSPDTGFASQIAAGILRPALASVRGDDPDRWGISEADVRRAMRDAPLKIRTGTLDVLVRWLHGDEDGVVEAWDKMVAPYFDRVWPKERRFVDDALNRDLMALAVGAGERFPQALATLRPYFSCYVRERASVHPIKGSDAPEKFPHQVLDLLWLIFGPTGTGSYDMAQVLDRLIKADPVLEVDRRLQSLEQRAFRFG
jgi:hypothetical protein